MSSYEQILASLSQLTKEQRDKLVETLSEMQDAGDNSALSQELIEALEKCTQNRSQILCCPHCGDIAVVRNGRKGGRRRYLCKDCHKTFGDTWGTFFWHCRLPKLCELILQLDGKQDDFASIAEADEYYLPLSFLGERNPRFFIETLGRMPNHNRGRQERYAYAEKAGYSVDCIEIVPGFEKSSEDKSAMKIANQLNATSDKAKVNEVLANLDKEQKRKRGISNQQVCIMSCVDLEKGMYFSPACVGRLAPKHIETEIGGKSHQVSTHQGRSILQNLIPAIQG